LFNITYLAMNFNYRKIRTMFINGYGILHYIVRGNRNEVPMNYKYAEKLPRFIFVIIVFHVNLCKEYFL